MHVPPVPLHPDGRYLLYARCKVFSVLLGFFGFITLISFWAVYYWPIVNFLLFVYLSVSSFRLVLLHQHQGSFFERAGSSVFAGSELLFILFGVGTLLSFAEAVVGVILVVVTDDSVFVVFQAISAATGVLSIFTLVMLQFSLRLLGMRLVVSGAPVVAYPRAPSPVGYPTYVHQHPPDGVHSASSMWVDNGPSASRRTSPHRYNAPRDAHDPFGSPAAPAAYYPNVVRANLYDEREVPPTIIPPAGLRQPPGSCAYSYTARSPPPTQHRGSAAPYATPRQQISFDSPASLYPERR